MVSNSMWCHTNITGEVRERERGRESRCIIVLSIDVNSG